MGESIQQLKNCMGVGRHVPVSRSGMQIQTFYGRDGSSSAAAGTPRHNLLVRAATRPSGGSGGREKRPPISTEGHGRAVSQRGRSLSAHASKRRAHPIAISGATSPSSSAPILRKVLEVACAVPSANRQGQVPAAHRAPPAAGWRRRRRGSGGSECRSSGPDVSPAAHAPPPCKRRNGTRGAARASNRRTPSAATLPTARRHYQLLPTRPLL
eukprot:scaffold70763_cov32-Tisochrysis_lutea.AAC.4